MKNQAQRQAIALNNHAALEIAVGNYEFAISLLRDAHRSAKQTKMDDESPCSSLAAVSLEQSLELWMRQTATPAAVWDSDNDCDEQGFVCRHAIHIPISPVPSSQFQPAVAIAIIFNLALAYHLRGLASTRTATTSSTISSTSKEEEEQSSAASLKKAVKLYEYAFKLYRVTDKVGCTNPEKALFLMGTVNNSGQIYHVLGREDAAATCFQELLSTLMVLRYFGQFNETSNTIRLIDASQCKGFFHNVSQWMTLGLTTTAGSA
jgi:tetratricopeptide (TPR) repeat protein